MVSEKPPEPEGPKLNVGCGTGGDLMPGWVNIDSTPGNGVDVVADCCDLPYDDGTASKIRCSHMVEHLSKPELVKFANECLRVLKHGGSLEVIAPSMDTIIETYLGQRHLESMETEDFIISPLDWLDNLLYSRHLHQADFHKQGIYPSKLRRIFHRFDLHQIEHQSRPHSRWEVRLSCIKPARLLCSIVLSTRNKARILDTALESIFVQNVPFSFEVIVVDDGSTDDTKAVCDKYGVQYHHLDSHRYRNPSVARNVGYLAARGDVVIAQSDDIVHISPHTIEFLASNLKEGEFLLAKVDNYRYVDGKPPEWIMNYCGPDNHRPFFFLGALWRKDLYAIGGCDEEFVEPCYDDNWFADCLQQGLQLKARYTDVVCGHHQSHNYGDTSTHANEDASRRLYNRKLEKSAKSGIFVSSGGPWPFDGTAPLPPKSNLVKLTPLVIAPALSAGPAGKIPRVMNFFWAGDRLSWLRYMTVFSFRKLHPNWTIHLHKMVAASGKSWASTETMDSDTFRGTDYMGQLDRLRVETKAWSPPIPNLTPAHASDICEWEILSGPGGFYADMDILFVSPIPYDRICNADAVFCLSHGFMTIGFFAASPDNPLFASVLKEATTGYAANGYQSAGAEAFYRLAGIGKTWANTNRPGDHVIATLGRKHPSLDIHELPSQTFYPFTYMEPEKIFGQTSPVPPGCVGLHWFGGNNLSQAWNNQLTDSNYREFRNTFTRIAELLLE